MTLIVDKILISQIIYSLLSSLNILLAAILKPALVAHFSKLIMIDYSVSDDSSIASISSE